MSDIIVNVPLDEGVTINVTGDDIIVNIINEPPVVVNLCDENGTVSTDYSALTGKPKINSVELVGNKSLLELGIEPKRGVDDFYVSNAEKGRLDKLLVDFTVPADTSSLTFDRDKNGVLFSELVIKRVIMSGKLITDILVAGGSERLSINGDNSNTYASAVSSAVLGGYRFPVYKLTGFEAILSIANGGCVLSGSVQASQTLVVTNTNVLSNVSFAGIKDGATTINSIKIERANNVFSFKAGSTIKIYRND